MAIKGQENLIPMNERTEEEQREIAKMGGIRSGEVRKEKATLKKAAEWLLNSDIKITQGKIYDYFINSGIDISQLTPDKAAILGLWSGIMQGNASNFKALQEANGESVEQDIKGTPSVNINIVDNSNLEKVLYEDNQD